jgi:DNA polymerase I-like protein with 3'-5' exonuclease and polymerase domains
VAHNIKFDLHYLAKDNKINVYEFFRNGGRLWDTMLAEYLLDGAKSLKSSGGMGYSLDACCEKESLGTKPHDLSGKYWSKGISTEDIPREEIIPYLLHDVAACGALAQMQMDSAAKRNILPWMLAMMDSVLGTFLIEHEGIKFDVPEAMERYDKALVTSSVARDEIAKLAQGKHSAWTTFNPLSPKDLSAYFFGGQIEITRVENMLDEDGERIRYKSGAKKGMYRTKKVKDKLVITRTLNPDKVGAKPTKQGNYTVDGEVLKEIADLPLLSAEMAKAIIMVRDLEKDAKTYYSGYSSKVGYDGMLHTSYRHTVTPTGRLSSTQPNIQNMKGHLKDLFLSSKGTFVEADFSQLEIRVLAELSQDKALQKDLDDGVDLHRRSAAAWLRIPESAVTEKQRKLAKGLNFGLQYGQKAGGMAKRNGIDKASAQAFIDSYYDRYPEVGKWQEHTKYCVDVTRKPWKIQEGQACGIGHMTYEYGRTFHFYQKPGKYSGKPEWYDPDLKNYPVQGVATGDVVLLCLGRLARRQLKDNCRWVLRNTVHDSFLADCEEEDLTYTSDVLQYYMGTMNTWMTDKLGFSWDSPLPTDVKSGPNWGSLTEKENG